VTPANAIDETNETLDAVRALSPAIGARADEIERGRRVPPDLVAELIAAGCFRSLVPRSHGGSEHDLPVHLAMLEELARADGSVGWTVTIGSTAPQLFGLLPPETFAAIYAEGPDVILGGAFNPTGEATPVDGGFRVTGQWAFASGCDHCHYFVAHCFVADGRVPPLRMMVLPRVDVELKDTWSVSGLCGTGSHDFVVNDAFVPAESSFSVFGETNLPGPIYRIPELSGSALAFASVAIGIAQGALDEIAAMAAHKVPAFSSSALAANPLFQHDYADAAATLRAAKALNAAAAHEAWQTALAGEPFTPELRASIRATAVWVT